MSTATNHATKDQMMIPRMNFVVMSPYDGLCGGLSSAAIEKGGNKIRCIVHCSFFVQYFFNSIFFGIIEVLCCYCNRSFVLLFSIVYFLSCDTSIAKNALY